MRKRIRFSLSPFRLLLVYAALNAVLYSMLLPLWEGFDEPFHFGYVQQLANGEGLPDVRSARLSREVWESILRAPASDPVKSNLPQVVAYTEYFSWPAERRSAARQSLRDIPPDYRWQLSSAGNYEAHHAPLAYLLLAGPERLLAGIPLPPRVLILRIMAALAGAFAGALAGAFTLFFSTTTSFLSLTPSGLGVELRGQASMLPEPWRISTAGHAVHGLDGCSRKGAAGVGATTVAGRAGTGCRLGSWK